MVVLKCLKCLESLSVISRISAMQYKISMVLNSLNETILKSAMSRKMCLLEDTIYALKLNLNTFLTHLNTLISEFILKKKYSGAIS